MSAKSNHLSSGLLVMRIVLQYVMTVATVSFVSLQYMREFYGNCMIRIMI